MADDEATKQTKELGELLSRLHKGDFDKALQEMRRRNQELEWQQLPDRIVLLRHGESEGNVDHELYTSKGDAKLELTACGIEQATEAGRKLQQIADTIQPKGDSLSIFVCTSPFERTTQTLLGLYKGGFGGENQEHVKRVHVDPQIREQEFGNFQDPGLTFKVRAEEQRVGRFYYRRPNAESSADVFDRVTQFWDKLFEENGKGLLTHEDANYDMCVVVTHGLTIRLMLMCLFKWSIETFSSVWNMGNCQYITLKKKEKRLGEKDPHEYEICIEESCPARWPWATREVWVVFRELRSGQQVQLSASGAEDFGYSESLPVTVTQLGSEGLVFIRLPDGREVQANREDLQDPKRDRQEEKKQKLEEAKAALIHDDEDAKNPDVKKDVQRLDKALDSLENKLLRDRSKPYTVINYLDIPQPRTMEFEKVLGRLLPGHGHGGKKPEDLEADLASATRLSPEDIDFIDWWGDNLSNQGKNLRDIRHGHTASKTSRGQSPSRKSLAPAESVAE